jgi:hypothetical protein
MILLKLKPRKADGLVLSFLEKKKLIRTLKPSGKLLNSQAANGAMETVYESASRWGSHKLICVKKNSPKIELNSHPDNEEFILINNHGAKFRKLCIIFGLLKRKELTAKIKRGLLSRDDFIAAVFEHNDHNTCIFTMLRDTVHCEVALPGRGVGPVFFVAEPSRLELKVFRTGGYKLEMDTGV